MTDVIPARFITIEGGEGTGKSTQAGRLSQTLSERGIRNIVTREPGGSDGAELIRKLLVEGEPNRWDPLVETLLIFAARADHVARTIRPALAAGQWVICDRFTDSTFAYQGAGRGLDPRLIRTVEDVSIGGFWPEFTIILDVAVKDALDRIGSRDHAENRFEKFDPEFHERLRTYFRDLARTEAQRCVLIDSNVPIDQVAQRIWSAVAERFKL
ncbi:MAG: dTMP kinase [Alphaproteobacteria bacterium]|nr:dTMP kinase [Alphaproteobacteria bacterium]